MPSQDRSAPALLEPYGNPHRLPSHISKTVLSTVRSGPPKWTRTSRLMACCGQRADGQQVLKASGPMLQLARGFRWKKKFHGMGVAEVRRLRVLEEENRNLKQLVADLNLDKQML